MPPEDPVESLQAVINWAKHARSLSHMLAGVRRIDESDEQTLDRLIRERGAIVKLLRSHEVAEHDHSDFDFEYKENFFVMVGRYLQPALDAWRK